MEDAVIVAAQRTPVGSFSGSFANLPAHELGAIAIRAALEKAGVDGAEVENNVKLAVRSVPYVDVLPVQGINVYDILRRDTLVLTKAAIDALEARFK